MKNPFFAVSLIFLSGIVTASLTGASAAILAAVFILSCVSLPLFIIFHKNDVLSVFFLSCLIFLSGAAHYISFNQTPKDHIRYLVSDEPKDMVLRGKIVDNPVFKRKFSYFPENDFLLKIDACRYGDKWVRTSGLVLVSVYFGGEKLLECADEVMLEGKVAAPKNFKGAGRFDYRKYLIHNGIYAVCKSGKNKNIEKISSSRNPWISFKKLLYSVKGKARDILLINIEPPYSNILAGMILNERQFIDNHINNIFLRTGTMHIIAISGLHFGVIVFVFLAMFRLFRVPQKISNILCVLLITAYALLVGEGASVWRSVIMADIFLIGFVMNRKADLLNMLGVSMALLLFIKPNYIYDIGFILSFACVLSIIVITPLTDSIFRVDGFDPAFKTRSFISKLKIYFIKSISLSLGVWLGVAPLSAYYFKTISTINVITNIVAVPLSFVMIGLGIIALLLNIILPGIALFLYETLWLVTKALVISLEFFAGIPGAFVEVKTFSWTYLLLYYIVLALCIRSFRLRKTKVRNTKVTLL